VARARRGSLELRKGSWHARVTVTREGKARREWYDLKTADRGTAERRLAKFLKDEAAGRGGQAAIRAASAPDSIAAYYETARARQRLSNQDIDNLRLHLLPRPLAQMAVDEAQSVDIKNFRDDVLKAKVKRCTGRRGETKQLDKKLRRPTTSKIMGALRRLFDCGVEDELITANPVREVKLPRLRGKDREIDKKRVILTDAEIITFIQCKAVDDELRMLSLAARCEGGMRTGDLNAWRYEMIDLEHSIECGIPRTKGAAPDVLEVPEVLRPYLVNWWRLNGCPTEGPVFPVRAEERAGEHRAERTSYAKRLRGGLVTARIFRKEPVTVEVSRPLGGAQQQALDLLSKGGTMRVENFGRALWPSEN
jgi:integrase